MRKSKRVKIELIILGIVILIACYNFFIINANIPSGSMIPTINPDDNVIVNKMAYIVNPPQRGDIIVFKSPEDKSVLYTKRVIGLEGDTIEIKEGQVYINGALYNEDYVTHNDIKNYGPYIVLEDSYFVLGDNRESSYDSRFWDNPYIEKKDIIGKIVLKYLPDFKWLN